MSNGYQEIHRDREAALRGVRPAIANRPAPAQSFSVGVHDGKTAAVSRHMDDTQERIAILEKTVADLWECVDDLYAKHGQNSPRWAQRRDMADYYECRRKAVELSQFLQQKP